jgi:pimeloyl-ACP methyl ester carboxylesterase
MAERHIEVPGGRLLVRDFGSGPPMVLLHAGIVDSWAWEPLTPLLMDAGYHVIAFDRRGAGGSRTEDVAFSDRADVIAVMDALGVERACLVGNSIGGQIAIDVAVESSERVAALVTIGANIGGYLPEPTPEEAALFDAPERLEEAGDPDAIADFDVRLWVDGPGQPTDRVPPEIRDLVREMCRENAAPGRLQGKPVPLEPPAAEQLERLTMPLLAIAGGLDVSVVIATARWLEANAPTAAAAVVPDVAHMIGLEAPEALAGLIVEFLEPLERWS